MQSGTTRNDDRAQSAPFPPIASLPSLHMFFDGVAAIYRRRLDKLAREAAENEAREVA